MQTFDGLAADNDVYSYGAYAAARAGTSGDIVTDWSTPSAVIGQMADWAGPGSDLIAEAFFAFDLTSVVHPILSATLRLRGVPDGVDGPFDLEARVHDWGAAVTTADWIPGADLAAKTLLATFDTAGWDNAGWNEFTSEAGFVGALTPGSVFRIVVVSAETTSNVEPTDREIVTCRQGDHADAPELILELDGSAVSLAGAQPAGAGALAFKRTLTHISMSGAQPTATGRVETAWVRRIGTEWSYVRALATLGSGQIEVADATYATARAGPGELLETLSTWSVGEAWGEFNALFRIYQQLLAFETGVIPAGKVVTSVTPEFVGMLAGGGYTGDAVTLELRGYPAWDGEASLDDWVPGADAAALTLLATCTVTPGSPALQSAWVEEGTALRDAVNLAGETKMLLCTSTFVAGSAPVGVNRIPTTSAVRTERVALVVTYTDVVVAGSLAAPSGSLVGLVVSKHLVGAQPTATGTVAWSGTRLTGAQPASTGVLLVVEDFHPPVILPRGRGLLVGRLGSGRARAERPGQ